MFDDANFRHLGGGRKGIFLLLRYMFIVASSYLLVFQAPDRPVSPPVAAMIAVALASNVALSFVPARHVFAWYLEAPLLVADTLWVSWALHATGSAGQEFFLLYFFVLFLAMLSENLPVMLVGTTVVSAANLYFASAGATWISAHILRVVFFYMVALFYGYVLSQIRHERARADKGFAWARELEAKVAERTVELRRLYEESLTASRLKSDLIASMSHELRTPLNIIIGYTDMLRDRDGGPSGEERYRMIGRIHDVSHELLHLVDGVLDLRCLESGRVSLVLEPLRVDRFMDYLRRRERLPLADGVSLQWQIAPDLPELETDVAKLAMVLDNLVNNAIKFTTAGRIVVSAAAVSARQQVIFRVEDSGPGIAGEHLEAIFEPFRQLDGNANRAAGVGLGLAIVRQYVALLGGDVGVRSEPGVGTSFEVTLPCRPAAAPRLALAAPDTARGRHAA